MPKPKMHWCTECKHPYSVWSSPMMKRVYERIPGGAFVPCGWICPLCHHMTSDAAENERLKDRAREINILMNDEDQEPPTGDPEPTHTVRGEKFTREPGQILNVKLCRARACAQLRERVPPNGKGWECSITRIQPGNMGLCPLE